MQAQGPPGHLAVVVASAPDRWPGSHARCRRPGPRDGRALTAAALRTQDPAEENASTVPRTSTSRTGSVCPPVARATTRRRRPACPTGCAAGACPGAVAAGASPGWQGRGAWQPSPGSWGMVCSTSQRGGAAGKQEPVYRRGTPAQRACQGHRLVGGVPALAPLRSISPARAACQAPCGWARPGAGSRGLPGGAHTQGLTAGAPTRVAGNDVAVARSREDPVTGCGTRQRQQVRPRPRLGPADRCRFGPFREGP